MRNKLGVGEKVQSFGTFWENQKERSERGVTKRTPGSEYLVGKSKEQTGIGLRRGAGGREQLGCEKGTLLKGRSTETSQLLRSGKNLVART